MSTIVPMTGSADACSSGGRGEIEPGNPRDTLNWEHAVYSRNQLSWELLPDQNLVLGISPSFATRTGDERQQSDPGARDPLEAQRELFTLVNGLEYGVSLFEDRLENRAFVKQYFQLAYADEEVAQNAFVSRERQTHRYGAGNGLRFRIVDWLYAEASYEWATRLPRADEVFGDNALSLPHLALKPEVSHNANLGVGLVATTGGGKWRSEVTGFCRDADELIARLTDDVFQFYRNVFGARSVGVEASAGWTAPSAGSCSTSAPPISRSATRPPPAPSLPTGVTASPIAPGSSAT